jgi:hypothetical protein
VFPFIARPKIFQSKRINCPDHNYGAAMKFKLENTWYSSIDARPSILEAVTELIPDDYYKVIDFYDRFRNMSAYKNGISKKAKAKKSGDIKDSSPDSQVNTITKIEDPEAIGPDGMKFDPRDKLIQDLEKRLAGCLKQIELTETYNTELVQLFEKQSAELLDLNRRYNQLTANQATEKAKQSIDTNTTIFTLKKQLADNQVVIARHKIIGDDLANLETELADT